MRSWTMVAAATLMAGAAALPVSAQVVPVPVATTPVAGAVLDVSAEGYVERTPDMATVRAGVVTQADTAAAAMAENARRMAAVTAALRQAGLAARDIQTAQIDLEPRYRYGENQPPVIMGYQARNGVEVRFRDVARAGAVLDALVAAGVNQIDGPALTLDRPEPALDEARAAAVRIARARAELYAGAAGLRVKRILSISETDRPSPPMPVAMMSARAGTAQDATAIQPGTQRIAMTVQVRFELE